MAIRPMTTVRHAITALLLFVAALAGVEFWMKGQATPPMTVVTTQTCSRNQPLLVPSEAFHHDLKPSTKTSMRLAERNANQVVRVNSLGCRGDEVANRAPQGTYRILILGDDTICGLSVEANATVAARLQQFLESNAAKNESENSGARSDFAAEFEVINGGVPGYCPLLSWLKFEHTLSRLKPNLVILHVDMTDIADDASYRSLMQAEERLAVCRHATFRLKPKAANPVLQYVSQSATASWLFAKARHRGPELLSVPPAAATCDIGLNWITDNVPDLRLQVRHALAPIKDLRDAVNQSGGQLLVTTSPVLWQVMSGDDAPVLTSRCGIKGVTPFESKFPFEVISRFCEQSRIHFFDASPAFRNENAEKLFSKEEPILSRLGMALYAREIAKTLFKDPPSQWSE